MQAMQLTFFFFLPSLLLSGFMFPFRGMPNGRSGSARSSPSPISCARSAAVMLKGADVSAIAREMAVLALFVAAYAALALTRFRRTLD